MDDNAALAKAMPEAAELIFGEFAGQKNKALSDAREWRWGSKGSVSVSIKEGVWTDHENGEGGGVLDLLRAYKGLEKPEGLEWLVERGLIPPSDKDRAKAAAKPAPGPFDKRVPEWMEHKPVAIYEYFDDQGKPAYEVLKFPKNAPRRYMQRRPHHDGGWIWGLSEDEYGKTRQGDWFKAKEGKNYAAREQ